MAGNTGSIVLRLSRRCFDSSVRDFRSLVQRKAPAVWEVLRNYERLPASRLIRRLDVDDVARLERGITTDGLLPHKSLTCFWRIDQVEEADISGLIESLRNIERTVPAVERQLREVYQLPTGSDPTGTVNDTFSNLQQHLDAAPNGIDARWAWDQVGGDASRAGFVDMERGWMLDPPHADLPQLTVLLPDYYEIRPDGAVHGTAVIGLVAGRHDGQGITGVAPRPKLVGVASHVIDGEPGNVAEAILTLIGAGKTGPDVLVGPGDVLLIEWQIDHVDGVHDVPAELYSATWGAIRTATRKGVVVVECAGNGDHSLDGYPQIARDASKIDSATASPMDSGAIIVGACRSALEFDPADPKTPGHRRWTLSQDVAGSNYGTRIDCHALGEHLVTAGPTFRPRAPLPSFIPPPGPPLTARVPAQSAYRRDFFGTSGAGAVVAGAAVVLQSMYMATHAGVAASPFALRHALMQGGTPQVAVDPILADHIGVMPNLRMAARELQRPLRAVGVRPRRRDRRA